MSTDLDVFSEVFTATNVSRLAWYGGTEIIDVAAAQLRQRGRISEHATIGAVLDASFDTLVAEYPVEYVYKACALDRMLFGVHSPRTTAYYPEFAVADSRADILLVNGHATVYEIKTRYDDFSRLESQLSDYYRCFTSVIVFVDPANASAAATRVPQHVGVVVLSKKYSMSVLRPPTDYAEQLQHYSMFRLLRQQEYLGIGRSMGVPVDSAHPARAHDLCFEAFREIPVMGAHSAVTNLLKKRQKTESIAALSRLLPRSLRVAAFSFRLRLSDWRTIVGLQARPFGRPRPG